MSLTQRQVTLGLFSIMAVGVLLLFVQQIFNGSSLLLILTSGAGVLVFGAFLFAYWRGWEYVRHIAVAFVAILIATTLPEPYLTQQVTLSIFLPSILALVLTEPAWVVGSAIVVYAGLLIRAYGAGVYSDPATIVLFIMIIGGMILARLVTDTAQRKVEENARHAQEARNRAETQARELADANELMNEQLDQQSKLLDLVNTLETPVVPLATGMLLAPIVGHVDTRRAQALTTRLLHEASAQRAKLVVLDIAGVSVMDTSVAKALVHTVHALRLLGCEVALSGISASVAMSLIHLGVNLDEVRTVRSPQEALANYLGSATPAGQRAAEKPRLKGLVTPLNSNGNGQISHN
jgi:anti-anti-sigma regulatory factor